MKFCLALAVLVVAAQAQAGDGYGACFLRNGVAHAMFCSKTSDSRSGTGTIVTYSRYGQELSRDIDIYVGVAVMGCDEVEQAQAPADAVGCSFEL
jgi:hypothetical protein